MIALPPPRTDGKISIEHCLATRRSQRSFRRGGVSLAEAGQLLWAAQGITHRDGFRTAPSAGALYPLETYLLCGQVEGLAPGVHKYDPRKHALVQIMPGDQRRALASAALDQAYVHECAFVIVLSGVIARTAKRYGGRATRYVHMEAGHAAQNVCLEAASLGLGAVTVGAFRDSEVQRLLKLPEEEAPLYILPIGRV